MPSPLYIDGAVGMVKGVSAAETGLKIDTFEVTPEDPKTYSFDQYGGKDGFSHGYDPSVTITVSGEITSSEVGIPISQFGTAVTFAGVGTFTWTDLMGADATADTAFAGVSSAGGFYPESISFSESRDGHRTMTLSAMSHPAIA